jgi:hypothetical protein
MKPLNSFLFMLVAAGSSLTADNKAIQSALLDDRVLYTVPVSTNRVTTISFPGTIAAIDGAGVSMDSKSAGQFQLAHTRGSAFFSLRALMPQASANLNVRWNHRTYVFELAESGNPLLSFILESPADQNKVQPAPELSPTGILALLDKAKAFPLLKKQNPDAVADVDFVSYADHASVTDFNDYEIRLEEAYRFNHEDTLVFRATLKNKTAEPILYRPGSFALRAGNRVYPQSLSDAPGVIPADGESAVYFAVTGTPDGGRNELSLKNTFSVLVERIATGKLKTPPEQTAVSPTAIPPNPATPRTVQSAQVQPTPDQPASDQPVQVESASAVHPTPELSQTRLQSLLNKAKAFQLLKRHHPEVVADVDVLTCDHPSVTDFNDCEIRLEEAYRFNRDDTLVLHATLKNKTAQPIRYNPTSFSLHAENRVYRQSAGDAPGIIPPNGESTVFFAVSGMADRGPIEFPNTFTVMIDR